MSSIVFGEVHSTWSTEAMGEFLAGLADSWSVNQRRHFFNVVNLSELTLQSKVKCENNSGS